MRFQTKPHLFFIFIVAQFSRENCTKLSEWFSDFFASKKWNWLRVSYNETGIKLWNHQFRSGKKMKLTARGFAAAVSFIFFPTDFGRFHNFSPLKIMKPQPVSFLSQNNRKQTASFIKFHVKLGTKKNKEGF